jgi:glycosyltransferase involved in cell wall biosynthesis
MLDAERKESVAGARFSLLIPSWNNLPYLRLCVDSIRKNSRYPHQIVVHVNQGEDGTLDWVRQAGLSYTHSRENIGVCWALNAMRRLVDTDYIVFLNDDMYVCPDWDEPLWREIHSLPDNRFFLSSTVLQPRQFWCSSVISPAPFGEHAEDFDEVGLLARYRDFPHADWAGATWPPNVVHRDVWDLVGGYSVELSPGVASDPDFSAKLVLAGVRHFKGLSESRVYHFEGRSTGRVKKNAGRKQFLMKWGITPSIFMGKVMRRGAPYSPLGEAPKPRVAVSVFRSRLKRVLLGFSAPGTTRKVWKL